MARRNMIDENQIEMVVVERPNELYHPNCRKKR